LSGHVLLAMLLSSGRPADKRQGLAQTEPQTSLVLLDLESPAEQAPVKQKSGTPPAASSSRTRTNLPRKSESAAPSVSGGETNPGTAINPGAAGIIPKIDWYREMEIAVETVSPKLVERYVQLCAQAERAHAPRPPGCNRRSFEGPWRPTGDWRLDMYDPDRPRSSVPDPLPPAFPEAPRLEVHQDEK
jgi:hypothetical protein